MKRYRAESNSRLPVSDYDSYYSQRDRYKAGISAGRTRSKVPVSVFDDPPPTRRLYQRNPLTAAQQRLAAKFMPLALSMAKPLKLSFPNDWAEFDSAACMAVVEAAQSYDSTFNVRFSTFARYRIWGALRDVQRNLTLPGWRGLRERTDRTPTMHSLWPDVEFHGRLLHMTPDPPVGSEMETVEALEHELEKLPRRNAEVCRSLYLEGKTMAQTAKQIGYSKTRVFDLHKEALQLLNERWQGVPPEEFFLK